MPSEPQATPEQEELILNRLGGAFRLDAAQVKQLEDETSLPRVEL